MTSSTGVGEFIPAPFTTMSTPPERSTTEPSRDCRSSFLLTSQGRKYPLPPACSMADKRSVALSGFLPTITISAPACASPWAISPQSTPVPPMTTAVLSFSPNKSSRKLLIIKNWFSERPGLLRPHDLFHLCEGGHGCIPRGGHGKAP